MTIQKNKTLCILYIQDCWVYDEQLGLLVAKIIKTCSRWHHLHAKIFREKKKKLCTYIPHCHPDFVRKVAVLLCSSPSSLWRFPAAEVHSPTWKMDSLTMTNQCTQVHTHTRKCLPMCTHTHTHTHVHTHMHTHTHTHRAKHISYPIITNEVYKACLHHYCSSDCSLLNCTIQQKGTAYSSFLSSSSSSSSVK